MAQKDVGRSRRNHRIGLYTRVEWATEAAYVFAQFIAIALVTTAGACPKQ